MTTEKIIHCIGDSHSCFFSGQDKITSECKIPFLKVYYIGPALAYNLRKSNSSSEGREKLFSTLSELNKGDYVMLCFGEIDCRAHLLKQAEKQKKDVKKIVEDCVGMYLKTIKEVKENGFDVIVWGAVPTSNDEFPINPEYPTFGKDTERNKVTKCFNDLLKNELPKIGVRFISIFDKLITPSFKTKSEFQMDGVHLSQKAMPFALDELRKKGILLI